MKTQILFKGFLLSTFTAALIAGCNFKDSDFFSIADSEPQQRVTLTVTTSGEGAGGVISNPPGIGCPDDCEEDYEIDTQVALTAIINNFETTDFTGWGGDCADAGDMEQAVLTMDSNKSCNASFERIPDPGEDVLPTGHFATGLNGIENPILLAGFNGNGNKFRAKQSGSASFGDLTGSFITVFADANGYQVLDLADGEVLLEESDLGGSGPFFGIAGASQEPTGADSPAMIVLGGANGFVLDRFDAEGPVEFAGTTFDVFPAGGSPITNVVTHVLPGAGVGFFVFDDTQNRYVPAEVGFPLNLFGDVQLISAYMHDDMLSDDPVPQPRGNFLVSSRELQSGIFLVKWDGSDPVRAIDNIGFDVRRLRCIVADEESGNLVCVASIFGHNRLGIMTWDGENEPVLTDFAELDAGPVGIDLRNLPNGNIAVVSTGFDNNTINETVLMANGRVQSNSTQSVLDGCQSPGHAIYIEDSEGFKILVTCYDSGSYMIIESEL